MALDKEYKIVGASRQCQACQRAFAVGDEYFSAVVETAEDDLLARQDFCPDCWKPEAATYFSFWKTHVPAAEEHRHRGPRLVDMGRLLQLFEHLAESEDVPAVRFRYVLALVLMRKRRLRIVESRRLGGGAGEELTLREVGTGRRHVVSCPSITEDEIRSVADRLREILDMPDKWDHVGEEAAEASAPPVESAEAPAEPPAAEEGKAPDA